MAYTVVLEMYQFIIVFGIHFDSQLARLAQHRIEEQEKEENC